MAKPTAKETELLSQLHAKFAAGTFSETDVHAAMILMRGHAGKGDVREIGDGIAHAERDQGRFFKRLSANRDVLNKLGKGSGVVNGTAVVAPNTFAANLNHTFAKFGLAPLPLTRCDLVLLCGLSVIQSGSLKFKDAHGKQRGEISISLTTDAFQLIASVPIRHNGKVVNAAFTIATAPNEWLPVCNPRARVKVTGLARVFVASGVPSVEGFAPFGVHVERASPIGQAEIAQVLATELQCHPTDFGMEFRTKTGENIPIRADGARLSVFTVNKHLHSSSEFAGALQRIGKLLGACVHDDSGAHWFLEDARCPTPPDGFHAHWVSKPVPHCILPAFIG